MKRLADIPRLLDELGIKYRTHGGELWAPCPSPKHKETRASWSIQCDPQSQSHGVFYCFGCHFTGNAPALVMERLGGVSWGYALQWITDKGLWLKGTLPLDARLEIRAPRARKLKIPAGLRGGPLDTWVTPARRYASSRGITSEQILRWRIMYGIDGDMVGRIVFPLRTLGGEWSSFHARTYAGHEKRYKNASEEDGYDPGAIFGEEFWPFDAGIKRASTVVLTEGSINALAAERAGATFIAAIGGSEAHARQLLKLSMWGRLVTLTDPDDAGDRLATSLQAQLARTTIVVRAPVPAGLDAQQMPLVQLKEVLDGIGVH